MRNMDMDKVANKVQTFAEFARSSSPAEEDQNVIERIYSI